MWIWMDTGCLGMGWGKLRLAILVEWNSMKILTWTETGWLETGWGDLRLKMEGWICMKNWIWMDIRYAVFYRSVLQNLDMNGKNVVNGVNVSGRIYLLWIWIWMDGDCWMPLILSTVSQTDRSRIKSSWMVWKKIFLCPGKILIVTGFFPRHRLDENYPRLSLKFDFTTDPFIYKISHTHTSNSTTWSLIDQ